jgi:hypothetical protein
MWPQFLQIKRPLGRTVIGRNLSSTTQYGQRTSLFCAIFAGTHWYKAVRRALGLASHMPV